MPRRRHSPGTVGGTNPARSRGDASGLQVHLLDVGSEQYGDCVLCQLGNRSILIDGGHPGDFRGKEGFPSIPAQLEQLFGHRPPFTIDLLVVTHCHLDHIGCAPDLVANDLDVKWSLMADERFGFPSSADAAGGAADNPAFRLTTALLEENRADLSHDSLQQFLQDAARLQDRYITMLETLHENARLFRYGRDNTDELVREFADFGLQILGPSLEQLQICADYIAQASHDAVERLSGVTDALDLAGEAALYRSLMHRAPGSSDVQDRPGPGAGKNDQSTLIKLSVNGAQVLLTGDMQFALPEVPGLDQLMTDLRKTVVKSGPYDFVKLAHHGSYNGLNEDVLRDWVQTPAFASSNGTNDATHPNPDVLKLLDENRDHLEWARTDRNGLVTITFSGKQPKLTATRGKLNDATPNSADASLGHAPGGSSVKDVLVERSTRRADGRSEITVTARVGDTVELRVTLTAAETTGSVVPTGGGSRNLGEVSPGRPHIGARRDSAALAKGRKLPALLFVTHPDKLAINIGRQEAAQAIRSIRDASQDLLEIQNPASPFVEVRQLLTKGHYAGVVVLGGYDVLPAQRLDVLDADLRRALAGETAKDADNFVIWSDEIYGDVDGDGLHELPVSRIPDAKSSHLVAAALSAGVPGNPGTRFGVRNSARPFASPIYGLLRGKAGLLVSALTSPREIGPKHADGSALYFMLHGSDSDGSRFWGESNGEILEAVNLSNVPDACVGVIFTGCCWGALTVQQIASRAAPAEPLPPRPVESSIALSFLQAGALAFVGCTGSHYSPTQAPYDYFGGPMHNAFWTRYNVGGSPAEALYGAKLDYLASLPHGRTSLIGRAVELKILKQYTCLGLGW